MPSTIDQHGYWLKIKKLLSDRGDKLNEKRSPEKSYKNDQTIIHFTCNLGILGGPHASTQKAHDIFQGKRCECNKHATATPSERKQVWLRVKKKLHDRGDEINMKVSGPETYENYHTLIHYTCNLGNLGGPHETTQKAQDILRDRRCICNKNAVPVNAKRQEGYNKLKSVLKKRGDRLLITLEEYENATQKVPYKCGRCGEVWSETAARSIIQQGTMHKCPDKPKI